MNMLRLFCITVLLISCRQSVKVNQQAVDSKTDSTFTSLDDVSVFAVPFNKYNIDTNKITLGVEPSFDTSFVVEVYKKGNDIQGVVHEVMPNNRKGISKFSSGVENVLSFGGMSFSLDRQTWHELTKKTENLLAEKLSVSNKMDKCYDGTKYYLAYNAKVVTGGNCRDSLFEVFVDYVKCNILNPIRAKRK